MMSLFITVNPTNPQTTEGMAASSSTVILSVSLARGPQNSEMKMAAPMPNGTASAMASSGDAGRARDERQRAVAHVALRGGVPFLAEEKLAEIEAVKQELRAFAEDEEEDAEDKQDGADAAQADQHFDRAFGEDLHAAAVWEGPASG